MATRRIAFAVLTLVSWAFPLHPQVLPQSRWIDWHNAGLIGSKVPDYPIQIFLKDLGAVGDGKSSCDTALANALRQLNGKPGTVVFDSGKFLFTQSIHLPDSTILRGQGAGRTQLVFKPKAPVDFIVVSGQLLPRKYALQSDHKKWSYRIHTEPLEENMEAKWAIVRQRDFHLMYSAWAYGSYAQIIRIREKAKQYVISACPLRKEFLLADSAYLQFVWMKTGVGIEDLAILRLDATPTTQTKNIYFNYASDCWVKGVQSDTCNFAHVDISNSMHIEVSHCYFHGAFDYGGGGKAYGVVLQSSSGHCLVENNIFQRLRHSILLQSGCNGNVIAYNYSRDPFWTSNPLYPNIPGDIAVHGNYPFSNLIEGNLISHIWLDDSHGLNGPNNTFFRNRPYNYGIRMTNASPGQNFIGNEIPTNVQIPLLGNSYTLRGHDHFEHGNHFLRTIIPAGTDFLDDVSYYQHFTPYFWKPALPFPPIGIPNAMNGNNPVSYYNYFSGSKAYGEKASTHTPVEWMDFKAENTNSRTSTFSGSVRNVEQVKYLLLELIVGQESIIIDSAAPTGSTATIAKDIYRHEMRDQYVRVQAFLWNGEVEYSPLVKIDRQVFSGVRDSPGSPTASDAKYILYNIAGKFLFSGKRNEVLEKINQTPIAQGVYILWCPEKSISEKIFIRQ